MTRSTERAWPYLAAVGAAASAGLGYLVGPPRDGGLILFWLVSLWTAALSYSLARDLHARVSRPSYWRKGLLRFCREAGLAGDVMLSTRRAIVAGVVSIAGAVACALVIIGGSESRVHSGLLTALISYGAWGGLPAEILLRDLWREENRRGER